MYEPTRNLLLRWLKVPPEPHAPFGDPASTRVFRAGRNYFNLRLLGWGIGQAFALAGIVFWLVVFISVEQSIKARRQAGGVAVAPTSARDFGDYLQKIGADEKPPATAAAPVTAAATPGTTAPAATASSDTKKESSNPPDGAKKRRPRARINGWAGFKQIFVELGMLLPPWSFPVIWALKILGFIIYLVQIPLTYAVRRLDFEMRWYVVTDRSLRIRTGVWSVQELTMSFANLQQVVVTQGPVQRLLGLADVRVQSAGGGGEHPGRKTGESLHTGHFHGVEHAAEIRDLILERLRRFRETGLGDPDEARHAHEPAAAPAGTAKAGGKSTGGSELLAAARELRDEAKALRAALG